MFRTLKSIGSRIFSASLALIFFCTNVGFSATPQATIWAERAGTKWNPQPALATPSQPNKPIVPPHNEPFLPFEPHFTKLVESLKHSHGKTRGAVIPKNWNKTVVVHIQDIHQNAEAQTNIGNSLENIFATKQVGLMALEGEFASINLSRFRNFSDQKTLRNVSDYFLRQGEMAGSIRAALFSADIPPVTGIDDAAHYQANINAYKTSSTQIAKARQDIQNLFVDLKNKKQATLRPALYAFDQRVEAYRNAKIPLSGYLGFLTAHDSLLPLQLELFKESLRMESKIDFSKVEGERKKLISKLAEKLNNNQTEELTLQTQRFRNGQITAADFYLSLQNLCKDAQLALSTYPAFDSFIRYTLMADSIDMDAVMRQMEDVEAARYAEFEPTSQETSLLQESKYLHLALKLIDYSLSSKEWREYKATPQTLNLSAFESFYDQAEARDAAMAANLLQQMRSNKTSAAVLVTGGFHSDGISRRLADAGVATIKFVPTLTKVENTSGAASLSVFNQDKGLLDQLFEGTKLFLSVRPTNVLKQVAGVTAAQSSAGADLLRDTAVQVQGHEIIRQGVSARIQVETNNGRITGVHTTRTRSSSLLNRLQNAFASIEQFFQSLTGALLGISHMVPPGLEPKQMKKAVLQELFLHTDGIGFIAPAVHLSEIGVLARLTQATAHDPVSIETILQLVRKEKGHVNEGFLQAALWALESQGWIVRHLRDDGNFNFSITKKGQDGAAHVSYYQPIFEFLPDIVRMDDILFSPAAHKNGDPSPRDDPALAKLAALVDLSKREWNLPSDMNPQLRTEMIAQMNGLLAGPIMVELRDKLVQLRGDAFDHVTTETIFDVNAIEGVSQSMDRTKKITETSVTGKPEALRIVFDLMLQQGWLKTVSNGKFALTSAGVEEMRLAWSYGVPVSYAPLYNQWGKLLYGINVATLFDEDADGNETHVNRLMNAKASGYTHKKSYMANEKLLQKLSEIFNQPLEQQPKFVADMGCGDGALLGLIFDHIKKHTVRGRHLDTHPLLILGADFNEYSQAITKFNLDKAGVPNNEVIFGNINNPDEYAKNIKTKFGFDMSDGLHVRSMLDHNRPFIEPDMVAAGKRKGQSLAVFVRPDGTLIPNNVVEQNLLEHYKKWAKHIGRHGLMVIELHTLPPHIAAQNIGKVMPTSYAMSHFPSAQYTIEAAIDIELAQDAGFVLDADKDVIYFPSKDLAMVTIKHLTRPNNDDPSKLPASTWGISGKTTYNLAFVVLITFTAMLVVGMDAPRLILGAAYLPALITLGLALFVLAYQCELILSAIRKAGQSEQRVYDPIEFIHNTSRRAISLVAVLLRQLPFPKKVRTYARDLYEHKWKAKVDSWNRNPGLIPQFVNALEIDNHLPIGASRWIRLKYFFRNSMIVGVQYGDIAINKKAMALLPTWMQYWFLRHAQNLLWYKLAVRRQTQAPDSPTAWQNARETVGNVIENIAVTFMDFVPFLSAGNVTHMASQHYRRMIAPYVPQTPLLEIPELNEVLGIRVWAKMENMHASRAYKYRMFGQIYNWFRMMTPYMRRQIKEILVASTGNQAYAVGMATNKVKEIFEADLAHLTARAYVGVNITPKKEENLKNLGMGMTKKNLETGRPNTNYGEANAAAQIEADSRTDALLTQHGSVNVMTAYSTLAEELDEQLTQAGSERLPTAVFIPYGSGGFFGGVKNALKKVQRLRALRLSYRNYKPYAVQTTRVSSGALSRGLKKPIAERSLFAVNADGIGVTVPDATAQTELRMNDETIVLDDLQVIAARVILKNLMDRDDIETTSATTLAALLISHERIKVKDHTKQAILVISGGNTTNRVPNNPNPTPEQTRNHRISRLIELLTWKPYPDLPPHIPTAWVPLAHKALKKYANDESVSLELRWEIRNLIGPSAPANLPFLLLLALDRNPSSERLAIYKKIGKSASVIEPLALMSLTLFGSVSANAVVILTMLLLHVALIARIGDSHFIKGRMENNMMFYLSIFAAYAFLGVGYPSKPDAVLIFPTLLLGGFHAVWDLRYFGALPEARSLGVNEAGPQVRVVELSQANNIDRVMRPVLAHLAVAPEARVVFVVAPTGNDTTNTIAEAALDVLTSGDIPRGRISFNLNSELSLSEILEEAHSGEPKRFVNGLWKSTFPRQSSRIEVIKTTDRWPPLSGSFKVGNWLTVYVNQVLEVMFRMDDETIDLNTAIQGALAAMKAA